MKIFQQSFVLTCMVGIFVFSSMAFSEVTVKIVSPFEGEVFESCQDITLVAEVLTTEGEEIVRVYFYNNETGLLGSDRSFPYEQELEKIKPGIYSITAVARISGTTNIESEPVKFAVDEDRIAAVECLLNPTFACDTIAPWYKYIPSDGLGTITILNDSARFNGGAYVRIDIQHPGYGIWGVNLMQAHVPLILGHTYKVSMLLDVDVRRMVGLQIAPWTDSFDDVHLLETFWVEGLTEYETEFTVEKDDYLSQSQYFFIGAGLHTEELYIKYISLIDKGETSIHQQFKGAVQNFQLFQAYPNPFNPTTTIEYELPQNKFVEIKIIDVLGREIRTLVSGEQSGGAHQITWNGLDNTGSPVASGVYFYTMTAEGFNETRKVLLIR